MLARCVIFICAAIAIFILWIMSKLKARRDKPESRVDARKGQHVNQPAGKITVKGVRRLPQTETSLKMAVTRKKMEIQRSHMPYWWENGWRKLEIGYSGFYRFGEHSWAGWIENPHGLEHLVFILRPPQELRRHEKWRCFTHVGKDWYGIHFHPGKSPKDVSSAIIYVQGIIAESFNVLGKEVTNEWVWLGRD
jgi:hypothetical protein